MVYDNKKYPPTRNLSTFVHWLRRRVDYTVEGGVSVWWDTEYRRRVRNRLKTKEKAKRQRGLRKGTKWARRLLMIKQRGRCARCQDVIVFGKDGNGTVDHIVPVYEGGNSHIENLQILCKDCHLEKDRYVTKPSGYKAIAEAFEKLAQEGRDEPGTSLLSDRPAYTKGTKGSED